MAKRYQNKPKWILLLSVILLLIAVGIFTLLRRNNWLNSPLMPSKAVRSTTATVVGKEYVKFDDQNKSYVNDPESVVEMRVGDEQWRVHYRIDSFEQIPELHRGSIQRREEQRIKTLGFRFWATDQNRYNRAMIGDKLEVSYHPISDSLIEVVSIRNLTHPNAP